MNVSFKVSKTLREIYRARNGWTMDLSLIEDETSGDLKYDLRMFSSDKSQCGEPILGHESLSAIIDAANKETAARKRAAKSTSGTTIRTRKSAAPKKSSKEGESK